MQNLFEVLLLSKISGCILIFLKKKHFIFRKFIKSFADIFEGYQICKQACFTKRLTLMTESKLEFSGMFGKPPALYKQTLAFLNIKRQQLEKNLKNSCEKFLKNIPTQLQGCHIFINDEILSNSYTSRISGILRSSNLEIFIHRDVYLGRIFLPIV